MVCTHNSTTAAIASLVKRPRTTPPIALNMAENQNSESEQFVKQVRHEATWSLDDLPRTVACAMNQGSSVTSMEFHTSRHTLLLVGTGNGEITLWEIGLRERLVSKPFEIWEIASCSAQFQDAIVKDSSVSITRVTWSPDGKLIGVAFSKHLIHLHAYHAPNDLRQHREIEAHIGGVNDIAFSYLKKGLRVVTCGDDKLIKVWNLNGQKLFTFEGHEAPVYSIRPHYKDNIPFVFSNALDGKIMAWLYDNIGSRVAYDTPGHWCTTMLYNSDGSRLFFCGTSKDGDSFLVEWNESIGEIKRTYSGFRTKSTGVVQFDTTQNHFLAAGEENQIKFWDADNVAMLTSTDAEGGLPNLPRLRFNKEGNLLAVTTADNGFKILANAKGLRSLQAFPEQLQEALRADEAQSSAGGPTVQQGQPKAQTTKGPNRVRKAPAWRDDYVDG